LEHKAETSSLVSSVGNYKKEIENLNKTFERMSKELESQKNLTSNLAMAGRTIPPVVTPSSS
jgi:predicted RNase H-like nuclease (RuvC/YqgF family)